MLVRLFFVTVLVVAAVGLSAATTRAQSPTTAITPTGGARDLGTAVNQNGNTWDITGGTRRGGNLFHGFGLFSVGSGDIANFNNSTGQATSNIVGRVTGGQVSNIFGTIQTTNFPGTNLFLINPAGWIFGSGAALNVSGSFHVSTADYVRFGDGSTFCANACPGGQASGLTSAPPAAFGFLGPAAAAPISVQKTSLQVPEGQTLSVVGGDLQIVDSSLTTPGGRVQLGSFASMGEATISGLDGAFSRLGAIQLARSSLTATGTATVDADGNVTGRDGGTLLIRGGQVDISGTTLDASGSFGGTANGSVVIRGGRLFVTDSSTISAINFGNTNGAAVAIGLEATGDITLSGGTGLQAFAAQRGDAGEVRIRAGSVTMQEGTFIDSITVGAGRGADVSIEAGSVTLASGARVTSQSLAEGAPAGRGGDITVTATGPVGSVTITGAGSGFISQSTSPDATSRGGTVSVSARSVTVDESGTITSASVGKAPGGAIAISAQDLSLSGGGTIQSITRIGTGGDVTVAATESATIAGAGSGIFSGGAAGASGVAPAGNISLTAGRLTIRDSGVVQSGTQLDVAGNITIAATDSITIANGGGIVSQAFAEKVGDVTISTPSLVMDRGLVQATTIQAGDAGKISANVGTLSLTGGAQIVTSSALSATGRGGNLTVTASDGVSISGSSPPDRPPVSPFSKDRSSGLFSTADGVGPAGQIAVSSPTLTLSDGAKISVATTGRGAAGDIRIDAGTTSVASGARIDSSTSGTGRGGSVSVTAGNSVTLTGADSGLFSTTSSQDSGAGAAGSINVSTPLLALADGGRISVATSGAGAAGNIVIDAATTSVASGARIDSSTSGTGSGGSLTVTAPDSLSLTGADSGLFSTTSSQDSGAGAAGSINVSTPRLALDNGGRISVATTGAGAAGNVVIDAATTSVASGARIDSGTSGSGHGGTITINTANGTLTLDGAGLFSDASGTGAGGDIAVTANQISLLGSGTISARSTGTPEALAGSINITFGDSLEMRNSSITTNSNAAPGGNVTITSPSTSSLMLLVDSQLTTSVRGGLGGGGDIKIGTNGSPLQFIVLNNGGIHADAFGGPGGNIDIFANVLLSSTPVESTITASSALSRPGIINISAVITNLSGVLAELPSETLKAAELIRASCTARLAEGKASSLVLAGREGVPLEPIGLLPSTLGEPRVAGVTPGIGQFLSAELPALRLSYLDSKCGQ